TGEHYEEHGAAGNGMWGHGSMHFGDGDQHAIQGPRGFAPPVFMKHLGEHYIIVLPPGTVTVPVTPPDTGETGNVGTGDSSSVGDTTKTTVVPARDKVHGTATANPDLVAVTTGRVATGNTIDSQALNVQSTATPVATSGASRQALTDVIDVASDSRSSAR